MTPEQAPPGTRILCVDPAHDSAVNEVTVVEWSPSEKCVRIIYPPYSSIDNGWWRSESQTANIRIVQKLTPITKVAPTPLMASESIKDANRTELFDILVYSLDVLRNCKSDLECAAHIMGDDFSSLKRVTDFLKTYGK